jgi:hypothetical protein
VAAAQTGGTLITDYTKTYLVRARLAFIAALVMVGASWVCSFLAVLKLNGLACTGEILEGYRTQDFVAFPLVGAVITAMIGGLAFGVREKLGTFPEIGWLSVPFEFVAYRVLLTTLAMLAFVTAVPVDQYLNIPNDCQLVAVPH